MHRNGGDRDMCSDYFQCVFSVLTRLDTLLDRGTSATDGRWLTIAVNLGRTGTANSNGHVKGHERISEFMD